MSGLLHGGAETGVDRLVTAPTQSGRHTVISMGGDGVLGARLREAGVTVITLDMEGASGILRGLWRLYRLLRNLQPDVVQTRSEERRVGKGWGSTCRCRWSADL